MQELIQIGILGDYNPASRYHQATQNALQHAAAALHFPIEITWIPTLDLDGAPASIKTTNSGTRLAELGVVSRNCQITEQVKHMSSTNCISCHHSNYGFGEVLDRFL